MANPEVYRLLPCPFCGGINIGIHGNGIGDFFAICGDLDEELSGCGARTDDRNCEDQKFAIERWNQRTR